MTGIFRNKTHLAVWAGIAALYSPILYQLYTSRWENIDYTHAYFILPVSLWLAWRDRAKLAQAAASRAPSGLRWAGMAGFGALMLIFGWRQDYLSVSTLSMLPVLFGTAAYLYGSSVNRILLFPVLYLLLLVPPPLGVLDSITLPMRHGVSAATEGVLRLFHYPITRDGLLFTVKGHEIYMGAPCSGFRSLITMLSLGLAYTYISKLSRTHKLILVASIVPLALTGNLLRIIGVCLATYHFSPEAGEKFHDISGYGIFLVLIAGLMGIEALLTKLSWKRKSSG